MNNFEDMLIGGRKKKSKRAGSKKARRSSRKKSNKSKKSKRSKRSKRSGGVDNFFRGERLGDCTFF